MHRRTLLHLGSLLLVCASGLLACAGPTASADTEVRRAPGRPPARPPLQTFAYDCEGTLVVAHFERPREVQLYLPNRAVRLPQAPAESGARFSDGDLGFWATGDREALLERAGQEARHCTENRGRSLRADAKLRGVRYRGVGNEPGWLLEIGPDSIVFEHDDGRRRAVFPLTAPHGDAPKGLTTYKTGKGWSRLIVSIEGDACRDAMSGEPFGTTVLVTLNGVSYSGCGDALR